MSEKEKEAQVSENETKGENFFFKHECTTVCQKGGATEILDINNFSVNCREVLELGFKRGPFKSCDSIGWNISMKLRPFVFFWCCGVPVLESNIETLSF